MAQLEAQLAEVRQTLGQVPEGDGPEAYASLRRRLEELETARRAEAELHEQEDAVRGEALRKQLAELEHEVAQKARRAMDDSMRSLQRRMLDLEAALANRTEDGPGGSPELGLVEGVVQALQAADARRRPWWRFWD
jgi:DNA-binding transcriptional MerR regulator